MLLRPNAKINLGLNIVSRRPDGYHNLETVFFPVPVCDTLQIERDDTVSSIVFSAADGLLLDCSDSDNLVVRLCRQIQKKYALGGMRIRLSKHIPFGAGLGGGSSDAAFAAIALNELFSLALSKEELKQEVRSLGADCAFFVENRPCYATGIGDILQPIDLSLQGYELLLVKPDGISVNTKTAYQGIVPRQPAFPLLQAVQLPVEQWEGLVVNDFEPAVFRAYPLVADIKQRLYDAGAVYAAMSGSGAAVFGLFRQGVLSDSLAFADCFTSRILLSTTPDRLLIDP